ncbi:cell division protein FtsQ/DivIB [Carnobacteriaceae bacterium zg-ZUI252]|nr:cell division protein FtsQ/DivIB [Carnobacteriaceae bacterium zg-ZUI252]QTU82696.1 cell division protein FtsQ/DivIB [Carnobacteriaceae bacterium zg-C25]
MREKQAKPIIHRDMTRVEKIISFILFMMLVTFIYLSLPLSRLQGVYVRNAGDVESQKIIDASKLKVNQHYFETIFLSGGITQRIQREVPKVKNVTYLLDEGNHLTLSIEEYPVIATVEHGNGKQVVLQNGQLLDEYVQKYIGSVPSLVWDGPSESLSRFSQEFAKLDDAIRLQVASVTYHETDRLMTVLYMKDGNQVKVNYTDFHQKLNYYNQFVSNIRHQKGIFDLTVGIFFSPYE